MHARPAGARAPATGRDTGWFHSWYLKRRNPALETSEDFLIACSSVAAACSCWMAWTEVVSRTDRSQVRQQVEDLVHDIYPGNQVLVTAREAGYREDAVFGDDFVRLDVQRLDDEQILHAGGQLVRPALPWGSRAAH